MVVEIVPDMVDHFICTATVVAFISMYEWNTVSIGYESGAIALGKGKNMTYSIHCFVCVPCITRTRTPKRRERGEASKLPLHHAPEPKIIITEKKKPTWKSRRATVRSSLIIRWYETQILCVGQCAFGRRCVLSACWRPPLDHCTMLLIHCAPLFILPI